MKTGRESKMIKMRSKENAQRTIPTALKTLTSNPFLHSSALLSETFFTGSNVP